MSEILDLIYEAQTLLTPIIEGSTPGEQEVDTKVQKAGKNGYKKDKVEMVSVEDALFPYQGNNKEQITQKIINKINELIEGRATLADLIQFVRQNTKRVRMK